MDNFKIEVIAESVEDLRAALQIAFNNAPGRLARGYWTDPKKGLVFYWDAKGQIPPFPFKKDFAVGFVEQWLQEADYGDEPDHDGSNHKGFRVYNDRWGHVDGVPDNHYSFVAIQPCWIMYGK